MLALNVALHPARALVPLRYFEQVAAPVFVWFLHGCVLAFGANEYALRLIPLIAGCAVVPAVWVAARECVGPRAALLATWLAATTPVLVRYSAEVKPYSVDALCAAVIVVLTVRVIRAPANGRGWLALALAGVAAIGLSVAAPFVLAPAIAAIGTSRLRAGGERIRYASALGTIWTMAFLPLYVLVYRAEPASSYMRHFWAQAFLGAQGSLGAAIRLLWQGLVSPFLAHNDPVAATLLGVLVVVGLVVTARTRLWVATLAAGPLVLMCIASIARVYPFSGRVGLVAVPGAAMLAARGAISLARHAMPARRTLAMLGASALVLAEPALGSAWLALIVRSPEEPRSVVRDLLARSRPDEPVYLFVRGVPDWLMYTTNWSSPDTSRALTLIGAVTRLGPNSGNAPPRGHTVGHEGDELRFPFRRSVELLGVPTGVEDVELAEPAQPEPDSGWADNEARRIVAEAHPGIWVVLIHHRPTVTQHLLDALCTAGARVTDESVRRTAAAYRMEFSEPQTDSGFVPRTHALGAQGPEDFACSPRPPRGRE